MTLPYTSIPSNGVECPLERKRELSMVYLPLRSITVMSALAPSSRLPPGRRNIALGEVQSASVSRSRLSSPRRTSEV